MPRGISQWSSIASRMARTVTEHERLTPSWSGACNQRATGYTVGISRIPIGRWNVPGPWLRGPRWRWYIWYYTLGKKGCYTPIEDNKTIVDRTFVFPLGWNWHDMDPWLFPNEIRHYLGQTFNARSSGIVELRNHSIGGRSPKSIFICDNFESIFAYFFKSFSDCSNNAPSNPYGY